MRQFGLKRDDTARSAVDELHQRSTTARFGPAEPIELFKYRLSAPDTPQRERAKDEGCV